MPGVTNYETPDQEYARLQRESDEARVSTSMMVDEIRRRLDVAGLVVEELTATEDDDPTSWRFVGTTVDGGAVYVGPVGTAAPR